MLLDGINGSNDHFQSNLAIHWVNALRVSNKLFCYTSEPNWRLIEENKEKCNYNKKREKHRCYWIETFKNPIYFDHFEAARSLLFAFSTSFLLSSFVLFHSSFCRCSFEVIQINFNMFLWCDCLAFPLHSSSYYKCRPKKEIILTNERKKGAHCKHQWFLIRKSKSFSHTSRWV